MYGALALNEYFDLVEKLAPLPGKKAIVLIRPGLRLELENVGLLLDLSSFAVRRRVSFYTVDSRGLEASCRSTTGPSRCCSIGVRVARSPISSGNWKWRNSPAVASKVSPEKPAGKAIGTNRLADIFDRVAQDASGYYVLSYYPIDLSSAGRFRALRVEVKRPGARVLQATKGYYEMRSTSLFAQGRPWPRTAPGDAARRRPGRPAGGGLGGDVRQ